jgi:hypothetical protein
MALSWGLSIFGANLAAWQALPPDVQAQLRAGVAELEGQIWDAADRETGEGLACNAGLPACSLARRGSMTIVPVSPADDDRRRRLLTEVVLPRWVSRCGPDCVDAWNAHLAPVFGVEAKAD